MANDPLKAAEKIAGRRYVSAAEAAAALGISRATLYAYVSRGMIYSEPASAGARSHRYAAEDVLRLRRRQEQRKDPEIVAEQALHFGGPVLASALTLIEDGSLYYRGQEATRLAREVTVEAVAALLWRGRRQPALAIADAALPPALPAAVPASPAIARFQVALPLAGVEDLEAYDLRPAAVVETGSRILNLLTALAGGDVEGGGPLVSRLRRAGRCRRKASGCSARRSFSAPITSSTSLPSPRAVWPRPEPPPTRSWRPGWRLWKGESTAAIHGGWRRCGATWASRRQRRAG